MRIEPPLEINDKGPNPLFYFVTLGLCVLGVFLLLGITARIHPSKPPGAWDLSSPALFKTKSSAAQWQNETFYYEVPNPESLAGVIFSAKGEIDASKFKALRIQIDKTAGFPGPEFLRIEMKSGDRVLRVFSTALSGGEKEMLQFPVRFSSPTPVTEIALLVSYAKAGAAKKGGLGIREISFSE